MKDALHRVVDRVVDVLDSNGRDVAHNMVDRVTGSVEVLLGGTFGPSRKVLTELEQARAGVRRLETEIEQQCATISSMTMVLDERDRDFKISQQETKTLRDLLTAARVDMSVYRTTIEKLEELKTPASRKQVLQSKRAAEDAIAKANAAKCEAERVIEEGRDDRQRRLAAEGEHSGLRMQIAAAEERGYLRSGQEAARLNDEVKRLEAMVTRLRARNTRKKAEVRAMAKR